MDCKQWRINENSLYINEVVCVCRRIHVPTYVHTYVNRKLEMKLGIRIEKAERTYVCKHKYIKIETCMWMKTKMEMEMENVHKSIQTVRKYKQMDTTDY